MAKDTKLSSKVTVKEYEEMLARKDRAGIVKFIKERFTERYITPMRVQSNIKSGFTVMAISCLMVEALESFFQGWPDTIGRGKSRQAFEKFFKRNPDFGFDRELSKEFYYQVRCGILHQAETTGGWHILRKGPLFKGDTKTLNANKFLDEVERSLTSYCKSLKDAELEDDIWNKLTNKMEAICLNCEA